MRALAFAVSLGLLAARSHAQETPPPPTAPPPTAAPAKPVQPAEEPAVGIRFEGWLPGTHDPALAGTFKVAFAIYRSPQGGAAIWTESRSVVVARGRMDLVLGTATPIPMEVHEATFKFLGAAVDGAPEVYPRFAIVNVVYLSPEAVARVVDEGGKQAAPREPAAARKVVALEAQAKATWREALAKARAAGGELPEYDEWYAALPALPRDALLARSGHYEWVKPWVYDTASHGHLNDLFRGRFQGCDYMDLSPTNGYAWRLATAPPPPTEPKEKSNQ
jgi:hypothetical protein